MKKLHLLLIGTLIASLSFFTACKKEEETPEEEETKAYVNDQSASTEMDEVLDNVNSLINNKIGGGSEQTRTAAYDLPCGVVSVDSSTTSGGYKVYKLNYGNQTACGYKKKSGKVHFTLNSGNYFYEAGAEFRIKFIDYKVEVNATKQVVTLNGTIIVTNVDGGYIWEVITGAKLSVTHDIRGYIDVTYADGEVRRRQYFQDRTWLCPGPPDWTSLVLTISGDTTIDNDLGTPISGYSEVGRIYEGNYEYSTLISTPFEWWNCGTTWAGPYVLVEGAATFEVEVPLIEATIEVEAGYYWDYTSSGSTPVYEGDCDGNAYKITTTIAGVEKTEYQLY